MSIFDFLKPKQKTDKELQAELKAFVKRIVAQQYIFPSEAIRYESMLKEIYLRGLEPCTELIIPKESK
jgi:hypothetical protein